MCGLVGCLDFSAATDPVVLRRMTDALSHRGPDAGGTYISGPIALGHRRLSVLDVAERANQPMIGGDGNALVFNGEIYNFRELRRELESLGRVFQTDSDTEVILAAYAAWGTGCLNRFNGMFAFALWDSVRRQLFLARDRAGEKPLFYVRTPGGIAFASEPIALRPYPGVGFQPSPEKLADYLMNNYVAGEQTLYAAIRRLPPGSFMLVKEQAEPKIERYWSLLPHFMSKRQGGEPEAAEALAALIDDATRLRLVSDVPIGAFLSAGLDSAAIVSSMTRSTKNVRTFTIGFEDESYDEIEGAKATAAALGVKHSYERLALDVDGMIAAIRHAAADPLADNSAVPTWFLCRFARQHVTVALSGDGGDELFAGYETYLADRLARSTASVPHHAWRLAEKANDALLPASSGKLSLDFKIRQLLRGVKLGWPRAHLAWRMIFSPEELAQIVHPHWQQMMLAPDPFAYHLERWHEAEACTPLDQSLFFDTNTWMVDDVLTKVDRMSMAHGLEVRPPLLDHRVMEFAASLPADYKLKGFRKKHVFKESQKRRVPVEVLRRKKLGFNAPMSDWLRGPLKEFAGTYLASARLGMWLRSDEVSRLWQEHQSRVRDHGFKLYGLLIFSVWLETYA